MQEAASEQKSVATEATTTPNQDSSETVETTEAPAEQLLDSGSTSAPEVPEKYELKLPEGSALEEGHIDAVAEYAKQLGLSNEKAQELLERDGATLASFQERQQAEYDKMADGWAMELKNDKKYGGDNFNKTVEQAKRAFDRFATGGLREAVKSLRWGNHPEVLKTFSDIEERLGDDSFVHPDIAAGPAHEMAPEDVFYGSKTSEE